ncbi:MAG: hemerythrin domain-containing protein [Actinomycetota bacterium]
MDALELLKDDHDRVKELLEDLESVDATRRRTELFTRVRKEMEVHESIEEEIFYPALKEHPKAREIVLEGYEEHHVVDELMGEISELSADDERWTAKLTVMKENLEHHIEEEEEDMFSTARDVFSDDELAELGARMSDRKSELQA